jgi:hypothetical protein
MLTRETLTANGAVSVSAIGYDHKVYRGYWHAETCYNNECWTECTPGDYIIERFEGIVFDNGFRYTESLVAMNKL